MPYSPPLSSTHPGKPSHKARGEGQVLRRTIYVATLAVTG